MINVNIKSKNLWKEIKKNSFKLWINGNIYSHKFEDIVNICQNIKKEALPSFLESIDGHFALIFQRNDLTCIAVDKIRSTPLFFTKIKNFYYIDCDPKNLVNLDEFSKTINEDAKLELAMSGFTIGNKTIYNNLYSLQAGEIVIFHNNDYEYLQYYKYFGEIIEKNFDQYLEELSNVTIKIFKKIINEIGNRQIIIPLSAGVDSRLIASLLSHLGVKNIKCYTYGTPGNFEAKIAKLVADKLGYEWRLIPLTYKNENKYYQSGEYNEYLNFSETFCSVPHIQGLSSIKYLKDLNWIDHDAIFINGSTGDFISGGHISLNMQNKINYSNFELRKANILNQIIEKHFSLWGNLKTKKNINKLKKNLWNEITKACGNLDKPAKDHLFYEYSEFMDRQSKYIITGQRTYEYYGHEWRLPLWDQDYLNFWKKVPLDLKLKKKLYLEMLKLKNYGNVWNKNFNNYKKTIVPKWIVPLRFICKIPFVFFGKKGRNAWKQFDINFFHYFINIIHTWDMLSYFRVVKDMFKKPRNSVSWTSEDYLSKF
jgi:asparagine synthase (glutamine-hydrolysing)